MKRRNVFFGWKGRTAEEARRREQNGSRENRMRLAAFGDIQTVYDVFHTSEEGLTEEQAECSRDEFGKNQVTQGKKEPLWKRIAGAFINPFTVVLLVLAGVAVLWLTVGINLVSLCLLTSLTEGSILAFRLVVIVKNRRLMGATPETIGKQK